MARGVTGPGYNYPDEVDNGLVHDEPLPALAPPTRVRTRMARNFSPTVKPTTLAGRDPYGSMEKS